MSWFIKTSIFSHLKSIDFSDNWIIKFKPIPSIWDIGEIMSSICSSRMNKDCIKHVCVLRILFIWVIDLLFMLELNLCFWIVRLFILGLLLNITAIPLNRTTICYKTHTWSEKHIVLDTLQLFHFYYLHLLIDGGFLWF